MVTIVGLLNFRDLPEFPMMLEFDLLEYLLCPVLMNVNNLFALTQAHLFPIDSGYTHCKYRARTDNNVSEFTHSNWITQSYYSSPKCRADFNKYMLYSFPSTFPHLLVIERSAIYQNNCLNEQIQNLALVLPYNEAHTNE